MLGQITPLVLTYNEAPNIGRVLACLTWADRVVVLDSFSTDETESIATGYPNVTFLQRRFDTHANQWNFGLRETVINTRWVLALDADYVLPDAFVEELRSLDPTEDLAGYSARFRYCIDGIPLPGAAYTPVTVLFRRDRAAYVQVGHTQRVRVEGRVKPLHTPIHHDDRKPLERWFASQVKYMELEAAAILDSSRKDLDWPDLVRRMIFVAPLAMFLYCLVVKLAILDGQRGWFYACQRAVAETILSVFLLQGILKR